MLINYYEAKFKGPFTDNRYNAAYSQLYNDIINYNTPQKKHCVIFLGGQPGSGKSSFYNQDSNLSGYIVIDGDKYRKYHPDYKEIIESDLDNYVERTQGFCNECVAHLINDLSDKGYNIIIEGTLRNAQVPIDTVALLEPKGYSTSLYVMAMDACESWKATINRAHLMMELGETPRLVPIDKYNTTVNALPDNISTLIECGVFNDAHIITRDNEIIYPNNNNISAREVFEEELNLDKWKQMYEDNVNSFVNNKIEVLQEAQRRRKGR